MSDAIDELKIEITAESKKADDKIDDLCNKIGKLASSLGSLGGKKPTGLKDFQKATEGVSKAATDLASKYKDLGKGFELKGSTQYLQKQVDNLSNALARATLKKNELEMSGSTGGQMYEYAVRDVIKYENQIESLKNQFASISETKLSPELELKLSNLEQVESQIKEIVEETPRVVEISADSFGYNQDAIEFIENYSERAKTSVQSLTEKLSELTVPEVRTDNIDKLTASIEKTEVKLEELRNKLSNAIVMGTVTESVDDSGYIRLQEQIALTEKQLEAFRAKKAEVESAPSTGLDGFQSKISKIGASLSKATSGFARFASGIKSVIAKIARLGKSILGLNKHTKGLNTSLSGGLKHLLAYGLGIRSLYALFNKLRNAIKEGIKNLVQFDSETNASMSLLANSLTQLKNATAAAVSPLLNALAPALNTIIQWCVSAANAVNQLIAALTGKSTWIKAKMLTDDYASSLDNAASSAKKLYNTVLPIDELNINSGETDTSGGSSGTSAGDMFEYEDISAKWADIADWLKSMWENADFTELGKLLGEKLKEALDNIDWESIKETARKIGKSIATFINGFVEVEGLGYSIGKTIAEALNTALEFLNSFAENLHWDSVGHFIADGINGLFLEFDWELLATTINNWANGMLDLIISTLQEVKWYEIGEKIGTFLAELDFVETGEKVGKAIWDAIGAGIELWKGSFDAATIETTIITAVALIKFTGLGTTILAAIKNSILAALGAEEGTAIGAAILTWIGKGIAGIGTKIGLLFEGLFSGLSFSEALVGAFGGSASSIAAVATTIAGVASTITGTFAAVASFVSMLVDGFSWIKEIVMVLGTALAAVGAVILGAPALVAGVVAAIVAAVATIVVVVHDNWDSIKEWFAGIGEWFSTTIVQPVGNAFKTLTEKIGGFFGSLWEKITSIWGTVSSWFSTNVIEPVVNFFVGFATRVQQVFEGLWIIIQAVWIIVSEFFNEYIITPITNAITTIIEWITETLTTLWEGIQAVWFTISEVFNEYVITPLINIFNTVYTKINEVFTNAWNKVVTIWTKAYNWFNTTVIIPISKAFEIACEKIKGFFDSLWKGIKKGVAGAFNVVIDVVESALNWLVDAINSIISGFNRVVSWAASIIEVDWGGVDLIPKVSLGRIDVSGFELGGFPKEYSLFMAGEHGIPEMLGTVGGKTAVAGGAEITGIREAVIETSNEEVQILREQNELLRMLLEKDMSVNIGDREVVESYNRGRSRMGFSFT